MLSFTGVFLIQPQCHPNVNLIYRQINMIGGNGQIKKQNELVNNEQTKEKNTNEPVG
jgi:hypothetical protein